MSGDAPTQPINRDARAFSLEKAKEGILAKLQEAGTVGARSFWTPQTPPARREATEHALSDLESSRALIVDRRRARPRFYLAQFAPALPSLDSACEKIVQLAARLHPALLTAAELKRALVSHERPYFADALVSLKERRQLLELRRKEAVLYADGESVRAMLAAHHEVLRASGDAPQLSPAAIREAYDALVQRDGFPSVEIAALQTQSQVELEALQRWLLDAYGQGQAVFSFGDWSLADEATRAAAISLHGERYLLVQLLD